MFFPVFTVLAAVVAAVDPLVDLTYAKYQGQTLQNGVNQWLALRFAAPPVGNLRFAAPQPPSTESATQDATTEGALCVSANNPEGLQYGSARQPMAEDCLFLAVYAPGNATEASNLPIMFFITGGGFTSNSNGNFNGTSLVQNSGMNMMVVRINYRVGILGFIAGSAVSSDTKGATMNNGLNDIVAALKWTKQYATKFGGNPNHIVLSGDSAGATAIDILLTANNGTGFPDLFVGAMAESTGFSGGEPYPVDRDAELANNFNSTGCAGAADPLDCMRQLPINVLQNTTTKDGWGPTIDGQLMVAPHSQLMEQGRFQKVPVIFGTASNEATPDYISNQSAANETDVSQHITSSVPSITDTQLQEVLTMYPESLNSVSFFGRNVSVKNQTAWKGKGAEWQRDAAVQTELKLTCTAAFFSDMFADAGQPSYHYRYNVLDTTPGGLADQGIFSPHTSELYAIWGRNNTDANDPKCFLTGASDGGCADSISIVQSYWISFVRTLDPNALKAPGSPVWETWSIKAPRRIVFDNANASMETMGAGEGEVTIAGLNQRQRCISMMTPLAKAMNQGVKKGQTLLPFANGTRPDPTLGSGISQAIIIFSNGSSTTLRTNGSLNAPVAFLGDAYSNRASVVLTVICFIFAALIL